MGAGVMVMAGGTGGHVFPALAVAQRLREQGIDVFWLGTHNGIEANLVPRAGFPVEWVSIKGLRGKGVMGWVLAPFKLAWAMIQAVGILRRRRPRVVLGMGGYVTGPGGLGARLLGIPLVVHEQNALPGLTNQWLARVASCVLEAFPGSFPASREASCVGNPVRPEIAELPEPGQRMAGRSGRVRLLVLGGSLGARALNETLPAALALLDEAQRPEILHQAGGRNLQTAEAAYREAGVEGEVRAFIDDMPASYAWADLVVCRSGALTVSELAAAGLGAILVPFPYAVDDHQTLNAGYLTGVGAAQLVPESELTPAGLAELLRGLIADRDRLLGMARSARGQARPEATEAVARACRELAA